MAGKVHFARGRFHASRAPTVGGIMFEEVERLRAAINQAVPGLDVNVEGLCILADAIALARARVKEHEQDATRQDALEQLKSMLRCNDDALILALRACDRRTLALVNGAQKQLIADIISATGCFVDVEGTEHRLKPPGIMFAAYTRPAGAPESPPADLEGFRRAVSATLKEKPDDGLKEWERALALAARGAVKAWRAADTCSGGYPDIYLPAGVEGVRKAVSAALANLREEHKAAGNRVKEWQRPLARAARDALRAFTGRAEVKAWRTAGTGRRAPLVDLVIVVFGFAGAELGEARALDLCKEILRGK